jgi:hemolysin activation/secretion protein
MSRLSINLSEVSVVKFKLNPLCWALAACLCISQSGVALATENVPSSQAATDAGLVFGIQQVVLVGNPGVLSRKTQERLLAVLAPAHGAQSGLQRLQVAVQQGQQLLDRLVPGGYVLSIPAQTIVDGGQVAVQVSPILQGVMIKGVPGFDEEVIRASLPSSLQKGAVLSGREWPTLQTLSMLNDHSLKATTILFHVEPDQPVTAEVTVSAPLGDAQTSVTLDSFGNDVIGRGMLAVTHTQGNVGVANDLLSFYGASSLNKPGQVGLASLRYTFPDVQAFSSHSLGVLHSASHVDTPFLSFGNIVGKGDYTELNYRQTHYLSEGKFFIDAALSKSQGNTQYLSSVLTDYSVVALPVTLGLEGVMNRQSSDPELLRDFGALSRVQVVLNKVGALGLSSQSDYEKARTGAGSSAILRWLVDGRATVLNQARMNVQFTGQYSANKLLPSGQMAVAGDRAGVRGFINSVLMGDSATVLRWELEPLVLNQGWQGYTSQPYVFYDVGSKRGGNDERKLSVSSSGVGWRLTPQSMTGLSLDVFAARKGQGAKLDLVPGTTREVDKTTYWATGTYRF